MTAQRVCVACVDCSISLVVSERILWGRTRCSSFVSVEREVANLSSAVSIVQRAIISSVGSDTPISLPQNLVRMLVAQVHLT